MMRVSFGRMAALCGLLAAAGPGQAYVAYNGFTLEPIGDARFEVFPRGGLNAIDGWCAVGDYVSTILSLPPDTPIWRISEPPRPRGGSIVFSLSADGAAASNGLQQINAEHVYLTAAAAYAFCPESRLFWEMW